MSWEEREEEEEEEEEEGLDTGGLRRYQKSSPGMNKSL